MRHLIARQLRYLEAVAATRTQTPDHAEVMARIEAATDLADVDDATLPSNETSRAPVVFDGRTAAEITLEHDAARQAADRRLTDLRSELGLDGPAR